MFRCDRSCRKFCDVLVLAVITQAALPPLLCSCAHFSPKHKQVLGSKRKTLAGYSSANINTHHGFIYGCSLVQTTPPGLRLKAARLAASKCSLLARVDAYGQDPSGEVRVHQGSKLSSSMLKLFSGLRLGFGSHLASAEAAAWCRSRYVACC